MDQHALGLQCDSAVNYLLRGPSFRCEARSTQRGCAIAKAFRVKDGKIAEHWDTIEAIPAEDQWKNGNGKF